MSHTPKATPSTTDDAQSNAYSERYFDALYSDNSDPWQYQSRWYEQRKRDMCLAVLPQLEYDKAIELGCGNGVFSVLLAQRCQTLLSIDGNDKAVQLAKQRLADASHVKVIQGVIPSILSTLQLADLTKTGLTKTDSTPAYQPPFDLIVISEILYYLSPADIDTVITWIKHNIAVGGTLLCCHWRYAIDGFVMTGETVHQRLQQAFNQEDEPDFTQPVFTHQSQLVDSDFLLDVWQNTPKTVAMQEKLV